MNKKIRELIENNTKDFFRYLDRVCKHEHKLLVKGNLLEILEDFKKDHHKGLEEIEEILTKVTESVTVGGNIYFELREKIGDSDFYLFNVESRCFEEISADQYLKEKEFFIDPNHPFDMPTLNFKTFYDKFPSVREYKSIGRGVEYLNRYLSSNMFTNPEKFRKALFDFLFLHKYNGQQLILNERIKNPDQLSGSIDKALSFLRKKDEDESYLLFKHDLQSLGFEPGLGNTAARIIEGLEELEQLLLSPDHEALKNFLSRIPMIFNIVVVSSHGYFGQEGVLGLPDTGGQVVYILDQVKALEKEMIHSLEQAGLDAVPKIIILTRLIPNAGGTRANQRLEKVHETNNVWILRVPFRTHNQKITDNWISRFEIWPYLEEFAEDSYKELMVEFGRRPDFIIGNYSDGNMVAYILSKKLGVTQAIIAHALEKSKYLYSALYWKNLEEQYHFSSHFTADLIAMNSANFIVTSTYQEIAGTDESIGQYESYENYTMPGLYRVKGGINLFHPKFNIVPPGVNKEVYFPYTNKSERLHETREELEKLIFRKQRGSGCCGNAEKSKVNADIFFGKIR